MLRIIKERLHQKYRTLDYPRREPALSPRYLGRPTLTDVDCGDCRACFTACPAGALLPSPSAASGPSGQSCGARTPLLDMGRCIFAAPAARPAPKGPSTSAGSTVWPPSGGRLCASRPCRPACPLRHPRRRARPAITACSAVPLSCARSAPGAATPARPTAMCWAPWCMIWAVSASNLRPRRAMPTVWWAPAR